MYNVYILLMYMCNYVRIIDFPPGNPKTSLYGKSIIGGIYS